MSNRDVQQCKESEKGEPTISQVCDKDRQSTRDRRRTRRHCPCLRVLGSSGWRWLFCLSAVSSVCLHHNLDTPLMSKKPPPPAPRKRPKPTVVSLFDVIESQLSGPQASTAGESKAGTSAKSRLPIESTQKPNVKPVKGEEKTAKHDTEKKKDVLGSGTTSAKDRAASKRQDVGSLSAKASSFVSLAQLTIKRALIFTVEPRRDHC